MKIKCATCHCFSGHHVRFLNFFLLQFLSQGIEAQIKECHCNQHLDSVSVFPYIQALRHRYVENEVENDEDGFKHHRQVFHVKQSVGDTVHDYLNQDESTY